MADSEWMGDGGEANGLSLLRKVKVENAVLL